jgi:hypothetical protein
VNADEAHAHEAAAGGDLRSAAQAGIRPGERRLLKAMPLHAITALHGEAGLRERLAMEADAFADADRDCITRALDLAARLHAADRRQREPYLSHLLRVAIRVISHYRVRDPDVVCAALLHDSVEDHATELAPGDGSQQGALGVLAEQFGDRVAGLVASVTNPPHEPGRDRHEQYREHVAASLERSPWARVIKASDFTDNGVGVIHTTGLKMDSLAAKYAPLVPVLRDLIGRPDTPLSDDVKRHILGQLDRAAQRFAAIRSGGPSGSGGSRQ